MDKAENEVLLQKMRAAQFIENNGKVLRTINILRHKYEQLKSVKYALEDMSEGDFLDSINFLSEAGYIKLRNIESKESAAIEDIDYKLVEAKVTVNGIRLLGGEFTDKMVKA